MRLINILLLVGLATAIVIPDEAVLNEMAESVIGDSKSVIERLPVDAIENAYNTGMSAVATTLDGALEAAQYVGEKLRDYKSMGYYAAQSWVESASLEDLSFDGNSDLSDAGHPHHPPHHRRPRHPHHHKPTKSVYELIASSKYTTKLASLINEFDDLVEILNGTAANYTVFAPTDKAFEKIPDHGKKPSKEFLRKLLAYHVSADFYPAGRVLVSHTVPTTLTEKSLGDEAQRLRLSIGLRGLSVNFFSRVVAVNIFGRNGVIHGIDSILIPPPTASKILSLLPGEFSTLELAIAKTGLTFDEAHEGGTLFAPTNFAFKMLGPKVNAFLFSSYGIKYLKALLQYHIVVDHTLYSDAYYGPQSDKVDEADIPKGHFHVDLPTLLGDRSLSIDVGRYGRLIDIRINGYTSVAIQDGIAKDGVIQVPRSVLIPPKTPGSSVDTYTGGEIEVEDLKERLEAYVEKDSWKGEDL